MTHSARLPTNSDGGWTGTGSALGCSEAGRCARSLLCTTRLGAAVHFPYYFDENWPAFGECLSDLTWMAATRRVLIIVGAEEVLADEPRVEFDVLRDVLVRAGEKWANPVSKGEAWDRPAVPFHVTLQRPIAVPGPSGDEVPELEPPR